MNTAVTDFNGYHSLGLPFFLFRIIVSSAKVHFLSWMESAWGLLLVHFSHGIDSQSSDRTSVRAIEGA